jgi:hypothetical protein
LPQVFRRRANAIARASLIGLIAFVALTATAAVIIDHSGYNSGAFEEKEQPIEFPHRHHTSDDGISCRYCQSSAEVSPRAGIPPTQTCMNCHTQIFADSPYLEPVRASWRENRPIQWVKVHDLPDFVYFDHSAHVNKGVGCSTCHGDVSKMALVYQVASLQMEWCLECHFAPERNLRPRDQIYNLSWKPGPNQSEEGRRLKEQYKVLDSSILVSCSTCHR